MTITMKKDVRRTAIAQIHGWGAFARRGAINHRYAKIDSSHLAVPLAFAINLSVISGNLDIVKMARNRA